MMQAVYAVSNSRAPLYCPVCSQQPLDAVETELSMMARVSLGHIGREIYQPAPPGVIWALVLMALALVATVLLPLVFSSLNLLWVGLSQPLWIAAFVLFVVLYGPLLCRPRVDGRRG